MERSVLVVGGGIGGIAAALELAGNGFPVYLAESNPAPGGTALQMDRWFPDNACQLCRMLPSFSGEDCSQSCLRRGLHHPAIELIPGATLVELTGEPGDFQATLSVRSSWVRAGRCTGCGKCEPVCPVSAAEHNAIYAAAPGVYAIDRERCNRCGQCVTACPADAIDLSLPDETRRLAVGAIIVASGSQMFDAARLGQYGWGRYPDVVTNLQLERMLDPAGASGGRVRRPSNGTPPRSVAFLQCVGSRDRERDYCSSVCCMASLKEAILLKEEDPARHVEVFYMDMRAAGKGHHRYYDEAKRVGIHFTVCRVPVVRQNHRTNDISVLAQGGEGKPVSRDFDMVVLAAGQCASPGNPELSRILGVGVNAWGFVRGEAFEAVRTGRQGVYLCGSAIAPSDIPETVSQACAAAGEVARLLYDGPQTLEAVEPAVCNGDAVRTAVVLCRCGDEIASAIDVHAAAALLRSIPDVVAVEQVGFLCHPEGRERAEKVITESGAERVVLGACSLRRHELESAARNAGIQSSLCQTVSLLEHVARVHVDPAAATDKAQRMLSMAVERLAGEELMPSSPVPVNQRALVVGGGVSGMVAALSLADRGLDVTLVEKSDRLGGSATGLDFDLQGRRVQDYVDGLVKAVGASPRIRLHMQSEVVGTEGFGGNFTSRIARRRQDGGPVDASAGEVIGHGAVIIATGAADYQPSEYLYGQNGRVTTQRGLRELLSSGAAVPAAIVMIQCAGSRDSERPYCSRTCCEEALASSLRIKHLSPGTRVFILYRDIMTCGFAEQYYTKAREAGVIFVRYDAENKPVLTARNEGLVVSVLDPVLGERLELQADLLVLSAGIVADNSKLSRVFGVELDRDGFFKEASKFRPVDTMKDAILVCGRANQPVTLDQAIVEAQAAAERAAAVLERQQLVPPAFISEVNERTCRGCGLCVAACAYSARVLDEERNVAVVREAFCRGCGACSAVCPNGAARLRGLKEAQVFGMLEAALGGKPGRVENG